MISFSLLEFYFCSLKFDFNSFQMSLEKCIVQKNSNQFVCIHLTWNIVQLFYKSTEFL